jgi:uncharacterized protein
VLFNQNNYLTGENMKLDAHRHLTKEANESNFDGTRERLLKDLVDNIISAAFVIADDLLGGDCADTSTLLKTFENDKNIFVIGSPNIMDPREDEINIFDKLLNNKAIIGLKLFPGHEPFYPTDPRCDEVYQLCIKHGVPIILHTGINTGDTDCAKYNDPKYIVEIAKKFPSLKIVIAHYFWPKLEYCYQTTKECNNIYFDSSALADQEVIDECGGIEKIIDVLTKTIKDKPDNVLFGTDYAMCDTSEHIKLIENLEISESLKEKVFYSNALKLFKITL